MGEKCAVCGSGLNLKNFPTDGYIENPKTFLSGSLYICSECIEICEICPKCDKYIPSLHIEPLISGFMKCNAFCNCKETAEEKEKRYKREALKYQIQQSKKRFEKTKAMLKDEEDKKRALEKERNIEIIEPEQIKEFICSFEYGDYILDSHLSHIFNITTQEIRRIIENNFSVFQEKEMYQISDIELKAIKNEFEDYITTTNPYALNINGVIKLSFYIENDIAKQFANDTITCLLENKLFNTKNEILTALYIALTDSFLYREIKEKPEKTKKYIEKLETENHELKKSEREEYQKGINLKYYLVIAIAIIITIFFNFVLD